LCDAAKSQSAFLIQNLLELAKIESGKARLSEKMGCKFRPRVSSWAGAGKGARLPAAKTMWETLIRYAVRNKIIEA